MRNYFFIAALLCLAIACSSPGKKEDSIGGSISISDSTKQADCVYLTADEKDQPVISWCETDKASGTKGFYMSFLNAGKNGFADRIAVPIEQSANFHEEGMPKLAFKSNGTIIAVYETSGTSETNRFAGFVKYIVSIDKGKSWSAPARLHADTSGENSHSFAAITRLSDGEIGACWLDQSFDKKPGGGRPVKFAKTNAGNTFENEIVIDSVACQCCRIAMSAGNDGKIAVAFRDILNDSIRDMSITSSADNGKTFTPAVSFSNDRWVINGCPHNGPSLAATGNTIFATWFTGGPQRGVYYGELNDKKEVTSKQLVSNHGRFIQLSLLNDGSRVIAYSENVQEAGKSYSKIVLNKLEHDKIYAADISTEKTMAGYPVIRSFGANDIVVAWTSDEKAYYEVRNANSISTAIQRAPVNNEPVADNIKLGSIKLASSTDLVCGMPLSLSPGDTTMVKDKVYGFCSEMCKKRFLQNPGSFAHK